MFRESHLLEELMVVLTRQPDGTQILVPTLRGGSGLYKKRKMDAGRGGGKTRIFLGRESVCNPDGRKTIPDG